MSEFRLPNNYKIFRLINKSVYNISGKKIRLHKINTVGYFTTHLINDFGSFREAVKLYENKKIYKINGIYYKIKIVIFETIGSFTIFLEVL